MGPHQLFCAPQVGSSLSGGRTADCEDHGLAGRRAHGPSGMRTFGEAPPPPTFFERLKSGLSKTGLGEILTKKKLDADTIAELEEALIRADMGTKQAQKLAAAVAKNRYDSEISEAELKSVLAGEIALMLAPVQKPLFVKQEKKRCGMLVAGGNGTGKTTTIGKLAKRFGETGAKVT